jgi:addiction module RelB/DinJ family antitoxin
MILMANQKTTTIKAVIDVDLKNSAEKTLKMLGMTSSEVIRILFAQIDLHKKIPFEITMPLKYNEETRQVIDEVVAGENLNYVDSIEQLKKELDEDC